MQIINLSGAIAGARVGTALIALLGMELLTFSGVGVAGSVALAGAFCGRGVNKTLLKSPLQECIELGNVIVNEIKIVLLQNRDRPAVLL